MEEQMNEGGKTVEETMGTQVGAVIDDYDFPKPSSIHHSLPSLSF